MPVAVTPLSDAIGAEVTGVAAPAVDAQVLTMLCHFFAELGLTRMVNASDGAAVTWRETGLLVTDPALPEANTWGARVTDPVPPVACREAVITAWLGKPGEPGPIVHDPQVSTAAREVGATSPVLTESPFSTTETVLV